MKGGFDHEETVTIKVIERLGVDNVDSWWSYVVARLSPEPRKSPTRTWC